MEVPIRGASLKLKSIPNSRHQVSYSDPIHTGYFGSGTSGCG